MYSLARKKTPTHKKDPLLLSGRILHAYSAYQKKYNKLV